ncbi:MAG: OmpA family protein [Prevotellaceae bacterium]|jgi:outer membrane protein OmpA-like peptidoglycan-associated protein|nr:OmpA family protein [Prevotellaceae bacterium]
MKRKLLLFSLALCSFSLFAADKEADKEKENSKFSLYTEGCNNHFSHWSITGKVGLTYFDGDASQKYNKITANAKEKLALGLAVEYTFNPRFGLALDYMYLPVSADEPNIKFTTQVHSPSLYLSTNLLNLFYDKRKSYRWAVYLNTGVAFSFYHGKLDKTSHPDHTITGYVPAVPADSLLPLKWKGGRSAALLLGLNVEYNITKHWAVGWYNQYRLQNKDNFEGAAQWKGITNDGIFASTLGVRYKFNPVEDCHVRNIDMKTYNGETDDDNKLADLEKRVKRLEDRADSIEPVIANLDKRVEDIEKYLAPEPDEDGDGVPDIRDREPNTPKGSFVNFWGESIPRPQQPGTNGEVGGWNIQSIFFDFDKYALRQRSKEIIQELALRLQQNPELKVEIRGYCDKPGTDKYNIKLSVNRCLAAKKELTEVYKIDESRIVINGFGRVVEPARIYQLNRRCDFYLSR